MTDPASILSPERLSKVGRRSVFLCAFGSVLLASFISLSLYAAVAGPIGLRFTESLAGRFNWLPASPPSFHGEWMSAGTMSPIEAGTEDQPLALLRSAAMEAAGPMVGGYFLIPFPWLALGTIHVLMWWAMLLLVLRQNGHAMLRSSDEELGAGRGRVFHSFAIWMAATAAIGAPLPALFMLVRMFWVGVSALDAVPLNTFGAGSLGLVCLVIGVALIYGAVLRFAAGVVVVGLRAREGRCLGCGYLCREIRPCPECGRMPPEAGRWLRRRRLCIALGIAALGAALLVAPLWLSWAAAVLV